MHNPLCCVTNAADAANANDRSPQPPLLPPPHLPSTADRQKPPVPSHFSQSQSFSSNNTADLRSNSAGRRGGRQMGRSLTSPARQPPRLLPSRSGRERPNGITIDDVVGSGVCGVLYKWVNYGRGWRRRWFALNDGVLSYYKIHGPDKIVVRNEGEIEGKLIGQESFKRMCSRRGSSGSTRSRCAKPAGEIHLKISTIRVSRSDQKRFSIYTGTKTVHLRAETREDRETWLDALNAAKEMFPRLSTSGLLDVTANDLALSTNKLKARLSQEGVCEAAIDDCEKIMKNEFCSIHNRLMALKQKETLLIDTIGHLEAEKMDLEHTFLDQMKRSKRDQGACLIAHGKSHGGISSDPDENVNGRENCGEETEDLDERFRDTEEFLSPCSSNSSESEFQDSSLDSDEEESPEMEDALVIKYNYPYVKRRKKLPDPVEKEKAVSLWSMIKDNIGKDLTKICLPVYFNEPLSSLQKGFEDFEYSYLIDRAYEWGKRGNSLMRMLNVAAFAVSGYASTEGRSCKPFNPLLGETYEADFPDKGIHFVSEKVSHHPMVIACHCDGRGWKFWGDCNLKNKFQGRSIQIDPVGVLTLEFDDGEVYQWSKVTTSIYNIIIGKIYCDHYGTMQIQGTSQHSCKIKFKEQSMMDRNPHQVHASVLDKKGNTVAKLFGKWDESLYYVEGDNLKKSKGSDSRSQSRLLWRRNKPPKFRNRYNLTRFALTLNEITTDLKAKLPPTDSRVRPDQRHLENGEYELANKEKLRLEQRQREARKMQEKGWKPRWFAKDKDSKSYRYVGGYWEAREQGKWESCPDVFGVAPATHS